MLQDKKAFKDLCKKYNVPLVVDEAHGCLWNFNKHLPETALKLGAENALGIDIEEQAIIASKENATRNCVAERLELFMDPKEMEDKPLSPVTVANILAGPLSMLEPAIASLTAKGGLLALSGILTEQADEVLKTYEKDFDMNPIKELNGWALLTGVRK